MLQGGFSPSQQHKQADAVILLRSHASQTFPSTLIGVANFLGTRTLAGRVTPVAPYSRASGLVGILSALTSLSRTLRFLGSEARAVLLNGIRSERTCQDRRRTLLVPDEDASRLASDCAASWCSILAQEMREMCEIGHNDEDGGKFFTAAELSRAFANAQRHAIVYLAWPRVPQPTKHHNSLEPDCIIGHGKGLLQSSRGAPQRG